MKANNYTAKKNQLPVEQIAIGFFGVWRDDWHTQKLVAPGLGIDLTHNQRSPSNTFHFNLQAYRMVVKPVLQVKENRKKFKFFHITFFRNRR